jgi:small-conductance mechanosensitive channel
MNGQKLQDALDALITTIRITLRTELTSIWLPVQVGSILVAALLAWGVSALIRKRFDLTSATMGWPAYLRLVTRTVVDNFGVLLFILIVVTFAAAIRASIEHPRIYLLSVAVDLATAWIVINLLTSVIRNAFVNRLVALTAWTIAALSILRLLDPVAEALNSLAIQIGGLRLSVLLVLKTAALLMLVLWVALGISRFIDRKLQASSDLTPSLKALIATVVRILLLSMAIVMVLNAVGIDLTALAFFSGAIGVGIGFGLQKIVSNLVSGIILLADKSIKPGDIVMLNDTNFGWVSTIGARYTSIDTRDGRSYLVPNEDFVTQRVVNWSYSDNRMMLEAKFGTSYDSNPHDVCRIAVAAAASVPRVAKDPSPVCWFLEFGESSLNFSLRYWIEDPERGVITVRAPVMLALWDAFKREGIEIPFPQRDINPRKPVRVIVERPQDNPA